MRNPRGVGGVGSVGGWGRSLTPHTPHTPHTPLPLKPTLCVRNPGSAGAGEAGGQHFSTRRCANDYAQ
ncbi:MAG: hypothetical protein V7K71_32430 [Nostoc sp.]|uniref:hypothetical protein n=1 Tax=Nostoc sp. TaxID=1180 RepID=UPI002FFC2D35